MTKYNDSPKDAEDSILHDQPLELPLGADFVTIVKRRPPAGFLDFCASYLSKLRQRPDYRQRRLQSCCDAEFDLEHPERVPSSYPVGLLDELLPK